MPKRPVTLDEIDHLLLGLVQADAARPLHELGDAVGLSPSAVQRRLARLRAAGVIRGEVAVVEPAAVGIGLTAVVLVALGDDDPDTHEAFRALLRAEPAVQQCYAIAGQWDYVVHLVTADLAANREMSRRLFVTVGKVARYETLPAYETVKYGLTLSLSPGTGDSRGPD
ncbi:Lrp/AsnC family transcriptional regulator [Streptomyces litchfieldiae]|uniref:Lrp/AsnC family transcriptional regulator n=1 Tax=Streptomyces litchfieldiae TaxID=3075543 RepID=A0ABU2MR71_9ACTN|nr:Lrp/AsnC family transcriptional regulator [Streptomyces sp. DSM 44938]MDT0343388.1 Lrp/AsnC family transcriptional regulator [Streptomyces sp. DSM 44938]